MLNNHEYVAEKLRRFQSERLDQASSRPPAPGRSKSGSRGVLSLLSRAAGRVVAGIKRRAWVGTHRPRTDLNLPDDRQGSVPTI